jgi:FkbM family methyltransferase
VHAQLRRLAARGPRHVGGTFRFPFGTFRYVDAASMCSQYDDIFHRGVYDFTTAREAPVIVDCGGNIGLSVVRFKQQYPRSVLTVFEADPGIADVLTHNLAVAGHTDVRVVRAAAWIAGGQVSFAADGGDSGRVVVGGGGGTVASVRLADFITGPTDLLKLDVEGAEYAILGDLCATGAIRHVDRLICEVHGRARERAAFGAVVEALAGRGFAFTFVAARPAPDLPGDPEPTPFRIAGDGKFLLQFYAWRDCVRCAL